MEHSTVIESAVQPPQAKRGRGGPRKVIEAYPCECGTTWFSKTSQWLTAIVDTDDAYLLQRWKWCAHSSDLQTAFYCVSRTYGKETGKSALLHQAVTGHKYAKLDHKDGNGHNCCKSNLRPYVGSQNNHNSVARRNCSSRFKGVSWVQWSRGTGKWLAQITANGKRFHLGFFDDEVEAARVYNEAATKHFGEFARLNNLLKKNKPTEERTIDLVSLGLVPAAIRRL